MYRRDNNRSQGSTQQLPQAVDRLNRFSKKEVVKGLMELNCFPIMMPVSGEMDTRKRVKDSGNG